MPCPIEAAIEPPSRGDDISDDISARRMHTHPVSKQNRDSGEIGCRQSPAASSTHSPSPSASVWLPLLMINGAGGVAAQAVRVAAAAGCRRRRRKGRHPQVNPLSLVP